MLNVGDNVEIVWARHPDTGMIGVITLIEENIVWYDDSRNCRVHIQYTNGVIRMWGCKRETGNYGHADAPCIKVIGHRMVANRERTLRRIDAKLARLDKSREKDKSRIATLTEKRRRYAIT